MVLSELVSLGFSREELEFFSDGVMSVMLSHKFRIPKRGGGYREIVVPTTRHMKILHSLSDILKRGYTAPSHVVGYIDGVSAVDGARVHVGRRYVFCTDLSDFFGSITHERLYYSLRMSGYDSEDSFLVADLCCLGGVLPVGSPCSPVLSNIVCSGFDGWLASVARRYSANVTRYADDITFSCDDNIFTDDFVEELRLGVERAGFRLNEKKTRLYDDSKSKRVTGIVVNEFANVPRSFVREIDNLLYIWDCHGYSDACRSYELHHPGWRGDLYVVLSGKIGWFHNVRPDSVACARFRKRLSRLRREMIEQNRIAQRECREWVDYKPALVPVLKPVVDEEAVVRSLSPLDFDDMSGDDNLPF